MAHLPEFELEALELDDLLFEDGFCRLSRAGDDQFGSHPSRWQQIVRSHLPVTIPFLKIGEEKEGIRSNEGTGFVSVIEQLADFFFGQFFHVGDDHVFMEEVAELIAFGYDAGEEGLQIRLQRQE